MLDTPNTSIASVILFLKATVKKNVWVPQFTKKNGQVVGGHFAMVHVSDDHDHAKVAGGAGSHSQKLAHAALKDEPGFPSLSAEDQAALVMHHATQIQDAASAAARLATLKKKLLAGEKPTPGEWKHFHAAPPEKQQAVMDVVHGAGKAGLMDSLYADYVAKLPPANEKPADAVPPAPSEPKAEPTPAPEAKPAADAEAEKKAKIEAKAKQLIANMSAGYKKASKENLFQKVNFPEGLIKDGMPGPNGEPAKPKITGNDEASAAVKGIAAALDAGDTAAIAKIKEQLPTTGKFHWHKIAAYADKAAAYVKTKAEPVKPASAAPAAPAADPYAAAGAKMDEAKAASNATHEATGTPTFTDAHGAEFWVLATGATNDKGQVFAHLASKEMGTIQKNGFHPKQSNLYVDPAAISDPKKAAAAAASASTGLAMPEFAEGKNSTGVKVYYEKVAKKVISLAGKGLLQDLENLFDDSKGQSWKGKTTNSKLLIALHASAMEAAKKVLPIPPDSGSMIDKDMAKMYEAAKAGDWDAAEKIAEEYSASSAMYKYSSNLFAHKPQATDGAAPAAAPESAARANKFTEAKKDPHKELAAQLKAANWSVMIGSKGVLLASSPDYPKTYANQTQAANVAAELYKDGFDAEVIGMHPYLVKIHGIVPGGKQAPLAPLPEDGPHEGDTKEGADGTLVLKDGHWIKQGEPQAAAEKSPAEGLAAQVSGSGFNAKVHSTMGVVLTDAAGTLKQYANKTQAENAVQTLAQVGFDAHVIGQYPFAVKITGKKPEPVMDADPAHDAKVAAANAEPVDAHAVQQLVNAFHDAKVPLSNTNAKAFNPKVDAIIAALQAGDKAALLGMSFGTNTYGKKAAKLTNEALAFLGTRHQVAPGQKAGEHPKYKVTAIKQGAPGAAPTPAAAAPEPAPAVAEPAAAAPAPGFGMFAGLQADVDEAVAKGDKSTLADIKKYLANPQNKDFKGSKELLAYMEAKQAPAAPAAAGPVPPSTENMSVLKKQTVDEITEALKNNDLAELEKQVAQMQGIVSFATIQKYAEDCIAHLKGADKQEALISGWKAAISSGKVPSKQQAEAMQALKQSDEDEHGEAWAEAMAEVVGVMGIDHGSEQAVIEADAKVMELHQQALGGTTPAAAAPGHIVLTESELPAMPDLTLIGSKIVAEELKKKALSGDLAGLQEMMASNDKVSSIGKLKTYAYNLEQALIKKGAQPGAAPAEQGPKEGDTKQGADGMLIFQNGRWHKMGDDPKVLKQKANSVPMPKLTGTNSIKMNKMIKALHQIAITEGAAGLAKVVTQTSNGASTKVHAGGYLYTISNDPDVHSQNGGKLINYAKGLLAAMEGTKGSGAPAEAPAAAAPKAAPAAGQQASKPALGGIKTLMVSRILNGGIQNADHWTKTGGQKGSNSGGFYTDSDGQQWYVKTPESDDHVKNELLANKLYAALGIKVPEVKQVKLGGKLSIASKVVDGLKKDPGALKSSPDMLMGFGADAWLANWDAVGLSFDNAMVDKDGSVYRIDPGGAMVYRAQGTAKGAAFGNSVTELDTLRDASKNPQAASVYGGMTPEQIEESVKQVLLLKDSAIQKLCMAYGPGDKATREALAAKLIARKADLAAKFPSAAKAAGPQKQVHIAPAPNFKEWNGPGQGLSSKVHVNEQNQRLANDMQKLAADGKLAELEGMQFQPINKDTGLAEGGMQPIAQHKSKHIPLYWKDLVDALKNPVRSMEHMKDAVVETVGGVFGTLISAFDDVKMLTSSASRIGRYAVLGKVDGDPFESWKPAGLSKANGKVNSKELYDASIAKYKALSNIEKEAIKQYTGSSYSSMNNPATGVGSHSNTDYAIAGVDKASVPLKAGTVLSRRFPFHNKADLDKFLSSAEGSILKDFGMVSTSLKSSFWHGQIQLRIVCGEGVKGCFVDRDPTTGGSPISQNPGEDEIILPYGTKFFVRKVHAKGHKFTDEHGDWGKHGGTEYVVEVVALPNS